MLGKSFSKIRKLEPWLNEAAPVTEATVIVPDIPLEKLNQTYIFGIVKLLIELHLQFDLVESSQQWECYKLVVIPDELMPERQYKYF